MKYAWIASNATQLNIRLMCQLLGVSRSAYYDWLNASPCLRKNEDDELIKKIQAIFTQSRDTYGTRRMKRMLSQQNLHISRRRISRLMKQQQLVCKTKRKFKVTTDSKHQLPIAPHLLQRQFTVEQPNQCYVGDMTYIPTREGWLYLAVVIDLFSRQVVGWTMETHMKAQLVNQALLMAIWTRKPARGLLWHTDRGSQYASDSHQMLLKDHGITHSMSRKGNCWDNAVAESFFHTLKVELIHQQAFKTTEEAKQAIFEYIEVFYNRIRLHSANDYLSPVDFETLKIAV